MAVHHCDIVRESFSVPLDLWVFGLFQNTDTLASFQAMLTKELNLLKGLKKISWFFFFNAKHALSQFTNHTLNVNLGHFFTLSKAQDLDPLKQKKADVMGLRKSPRGVKPHPHTPNSPLLLSKIPSTLIHHPNHLNHWPCLGSDTGVVNLIPKCNRSETSLLELLDNGM